MCCHCMSRREFMGVTSAGLVASAIGTSVVGAPSAKIAWEPDQKILNWGKPTRVQPVLMYEFYKKREATSWRPWGGIHNQTDLAQEQNRIQSELAQLEKKADFPMKINPLLSISTREEAANIKDRGGYDVMLVYAASGGGHVLDTIYSDNTDNLMFVRHRSGPVYLWYEIAHCRFLRRGGADFEVDEYRQPSGMDVHDVIVDDYDEVLWKLRALHGKQNFIGKRIVTLGGPGGWCAPKAPQVVADKFKIEFINVTYDELGKRIASARANPTMQRDAKKWAQRYLDLPNTKLETERGFVEKAFLLYGIFREILQQHQADTFTINDCMTTIIPMSETTACLPLSLLNDEGYVAFCESDFNVIPSGILLHHISGKPVFLNDPTYPHHQIVTCAHCTAPRRMDGETYFPSRVMTHFESDYGATPKVDLPKGTPVTMICPDAGQNEWVGFTGTVIDSPFYDICRSQYDIEVNGNWQKLLEDMRGFHWMMACGDYSRELHFANRKIGIRWNDISRA